MSKRKRKPTLSWPSASSSDLVVGDAVNLTVIGTRRHNTSDDLVAQTPVDRGRGSFLVNVPCPFEFSGRIVAIDRLVGSPGFTTFTIERTAEGRDNDDRAIPPSVVREFGVEELDKPSANLLRSIERGPIERTDDAGRRMLLGMLHAAAGGDHRSEDAIKRVAACVDPLDVERAGKDNLPTTIGADRARKMLGGHARYVEAVVRQLNGTAKPEAMPFQEPEQEQSPTSVVECRDEEAIAILKLFPHARIVDVRRRGRADVAVQNDEPVIAGKADSPFAP